ncbi:ABC transporter permease [Microbacterium sp. No. 7]|nr:ABC transporter permease [Microbacterium sp. No. 7]
MISVFVSACFGTRDIPIATTWQAIVAFDPESSEHLLVVNQRIPRALVSVLVGLCLGVAGAVMQALTRNPLAEPGILGVNAGAAVLIACGIAFFSLTEPVDYMWLGLLGAALAGAAVYLLGGVRRGTNPVRLVLAGAALTVVLGALTQLIIINGLEEVFDRYRHWMVGSVAGRGYEVLLPVGLLAAVGLVLAFALARPLDAAMLGEDLSRSLGGSPNRVWALAGVAVIVLAGSATAAAGPIAFLGLAAPHLARLVAGVDHRWVLPYSGLLAALLIVVADTLGRVIPPKGEVSVGIMVALLGGPFFVYLVRTRRLAQL